MPLYLRVFHAQKKGFTLKDSIKLKNTRVPQLHTIIQLFSMLSSKGAHMQLCLISKGIGTKCNVECEVYTHKYELF